MEKKVKIEISLRLKKYLDWSNVNKTMSYDKMIWMDIDELDVYLDWSEKHPEYTEEIRKLYVERRKKRLASLSKITKRKRKPKKSSKVQQP